MDQRLSTNKRVLMLLTNAFDPDPRVHQEARALVENGYEVTILCWDRDSQTSPYDMVDGIKVERIHVKSTHGRGSTQVVFLLLFWWKAYLRAISKNFSVVHCHDFDTLPLGLFLSKKHKSKLVYDAHESYVDMLGNIPQWFKKLIYKAETLMIRHTDLLITVGEILEETFKKRGAKSTCVVGNWKDPGKYKFPKEVIEAEKRKLKIVNGQFVISFIANLGMERMLPQLIEAVADHPSLFLIIGGDGPLRGIAEEATRRYPNIVYLGRVLPSKVPLYTAASDVVFYGFDPQNPNAKYSAPNKLFEALAAGKSVLTADFGEIGRIVKETKCGFILQDYTATEIRTALEKLEVRTLTQQNECSRRAGEGKFNWQRARLTLISSYESVFN